jgi:hypothetical protein
MKCGDCYFYWECEVYEQKDAEGAICKEFEEGPIIIWEPDAIVDASFSSCDGNY